MPSHCRFGNIAFRPLLLYPLPDPVSGVSLLSRALSIRLQNLIDEIAHRPDLRPLPLRSFPLRRIRIRQCLAHHPAVHAEFLRYGFDRSRAELELPSDLLKQLHFRPPVQRCASVSTTFPSKQSRSPGYQGWAKSDDQSGPNESIEITRRDLTGSNRVIGKVCCCNRNSREHSVGYSTCRNAQAHSRTCET